MSPEDISLFLQGVFEAAGRAIGGKAPRDRLIDVMSRITEALGPTAVWDEDVITAEVEGATVTVAARQVAPFGEEETERYRQAAEWAPLRWSTVRAVRLDPGNGWVFVMLAPNEDELERIRVIVDEATLLA